jgi:hypothetical protein
VSLRRAVTVGGGFSPVAAASFPLHEVIAPARAARRADNFLVGRLLLKHGGGGCGTVLLHVVRAFIPPLGPSACQLAVSPQKCIARRSARIARARGRLYRIFTHACVREFVPTRRSRGCVSRRRRRSRRR